MEDERDKLIQELVAELQWWVARTDDFYPESTIKLLRKANQIRQEGEHE